MGAGLAGRPPCLPQSGPYGCWVSWETSLSTTQSGPFGCGLAVRPPCPLFHELQVYNMVAAGPLLSFNQETL